MNIGGGKQGLRLSLALAAVLMLAVPAFAPPGARIVLPPSPPHIEGPRVEVPRPDIHTPPDTITLPHIEVGRKPAEDVERQRAFENIDPLSSDSQYYSLEDASPADKLKIEADFARDGIADQVGVRKWKLIRRPTAAEMLDMMGVLRRALPGDVELATFLDPNGVFKRPLVKMRLAWGDRPVSKMRSGPFLDRYLEERRGQTLIVVGHVVDQAFVMNLSTGGKIEIDIKLLMASAQQHGVTLIPIGCSTAAAGVPFGFIEPIDTTNVAAFLKALPVSGPKFADIMAGMPDIGEIRVDLGETTSFFEALIFRKQEAGTPPNDSPMIRLVIPYSPMPTAGAGLTPAGPSANGSAPPVWDSGADPSPTPGTNVTPSEPYVLPATSPPILALLFNPLTYLPLLAGFLITGSNIVARLRSGEYNYLWKPAGIEYWISELTIILAKLIYWTIISSFWFLALIYFCSVGWAEGGGFLQFLFGAIGSIFILMILVSKIRSNGDTVERRAKLD